MLTEWSVKGFKAIKDSQPISLTSINVFAGANSSGKSSLIQSILLIKQTLQYGPSSRYLQLNGPLLRLGTFDDVLYAGPECSHISINFNFNVTGDLRQGPRQTASWVSAINRSIYGAPQVAPRTITGKFTWSPKKPEAGAGAGIGAGDEVHRLQSRLDLGFIEIERGLPDSTELYKQYASYKPKDSSARAAAPGSLGWFDIELDPLSEAEIYKGRASAKVRSMVSDHFLPNFIEISYDSARQKAHDLAEAICSSSSLLYQARLKDETISPHVVFAINEWLSDNNEPTLPSDHPITAISINERLQNLIYVKTHRPRSLQLLSLGPGRVPTEIRNLQERIEAALIEELPDSPVIDTDFEQLRGLGMVKDFMEEFFKIGVRYLGPLRDEPRPVYPLEALENPTDVGYRGEHTAAVLELNRNVSVQYVPSKCFADDSPRLTISHAKLKDAVVDWLRYMGIAADVDATEAGVFGNRLQVTTDGLDKLHDLTNVGVGVSQVLPIVVSSLLAPPTSLLIFEQPELHLHPRVQARLADFFLAISHSKKQCILETHSEYLIDRLRRRIAESQSDSLSQSISIYFTQRTHGQTTFTPIKVNDYGAIANWPADFFDQGQLETNSILTAAAKKRSDERRKR